MAHPLRIKRKHYLEKLPKGAKLVARPSKWGNPFSVIEFQINYGVAVFGQHIANTNTKEDALCMVMDFYISYLEHSIHGQRIAALARRDLKGKKLACYCDLDQVCHADVLCRIANVEKCYDVLASRDKCPECGKAVDIHGCKKCGTVYGRRGWRQLGVYE